jgi:hypothetical protein
MEGAKTWLSSLAADFFDTGIQEQILFPNTSASIPAVTTLRGSSGMYVFFVYNNFFSLLFFVSRSPKITFRIDLVRKEIREINLKRKRLQENVSKMLLFVIVLGVHSNLRSFVKSIYSMNQVTSHFL